MSRRANNEGSVYQRADGRWVGAFTIDWTDGRQKRRVVYAWTQKEVLAKLAAVRRQNAAGVRVDLAEQTVAQFLARWLEWKKTHVRPRTSATYESYIDGHVAQDLGRIRLQRLRVEDVQKMLDARLDTMTPRSVQALRDILRGALSDAVKWGEVERNVAKLARPPAQVRREVQALTPANAKALLAQVAGDRLEALYKVALSLGLRRSEVCGLKWEDVDLRAGRLRVRRGLHEVKGVGLVEEEPKSTTSRREVALPAFAVDGLRAHRRLQRAERLRAGDRWVDSGFVFVDRWGRPTKPDYLTRDFKTRATKAGLGYMHFHELRHGAATLMLAQGVPLIVVKETLGHATLGVTSDLYAHVAAEVQKQAADAIDAVLG